MFKLKYEPASGIEKTILNTWVVDALRAQTGRNALAEIFAQMETSLSSKVLNSMDPEFIRKSIHIQTRPGSSANSVEYRLSLVGEGSEDEIEFMNTIISRINNELDLQLSQTNREKVLGRLTEDFEELHDSRLQQVSGQITGVLDRLSTADNDIRIVASDLQNLTSVSQPSNRALLGRPSSMELQSLRTEKKRLMDQQGMNDYHPKIVEIRRKIEKLSTTVPAVNASTSRSSTFSAAPGGAVFVKNQFDGNNRPVPEYSLDAEPSNESFTAPVSEIVKDIQLIDLRGSRQALSDVQESIDDLEGTQVVISRLGERAIKDLQFQSPIEVADFQIARRSSPIGGAPTANQFIFLLMFAGFFGTIVALNYDPALKKRPFRSVDQLQRKLAVPVIGVLRNRSLETHRPLNKLAAAKTVQFCEWTLLALAVLLIFAALANSEVAAAFIENPFHGITRTIWLISPNH